MASVAIFNSKGGVGKTTIAVNLAWEPSQAGYRTLLWEIDEQGDSSWILSADRPAERADMAVVMNGIRDIRDYARPSRIERLDVVAGDTDLRRTDNFFVHHMRHQRLARLFAALKDYDIVILDCAPGFSDANRKILLVADLIIVPIIPSALSQRGMLRIRDFLVRNRGHHPPMLPVFSMVDRRRKVHVAALASHGDWPVLPMASEIEQMAQRRAPIGVSRLPGWARVFFHQLWLGIEAKLRRMLLLKQMRAAAE